MTVLITKTTSFAFLFPRRIKCRKCFFLQPPIPSQHHYSLKPKEYFPKPWRLQNANADNTSKSKPRHPCFSVVSKLYFLVTFIVNGQCFLRHACFMIHDQKIPFRWYHKSRFWFHCSILFFFISIVCVCVCAPIYISKLLYD